jgi:hypothetical protein
MFKNVAILFAFLFNILVPTSSTAPSKQHHYQSQIARQPIELTSMRARKLGLKIPKF